MLYLGQTHAVAVPIPNDHAITIDVIRSAFEKSYLKSYSRLLTEIPIRILNLRLSIIGKRPQIDVKMLASGPRSESVEACRIAGQKIFANGIWYDAAIYERLKLPAGSKISGPALLVQPDATIYIDPSLYAVVDDFGNIIMKQEVT
jgi:N-methylhydantoinase A